MTSSISMLTDLETGARIPLRPQAAKVIFTRLSREILPASSNNLSNRYETFDLTAIRVQSNHT